MSRETTFGRLLVGCVTEGEVSIINLNILINHPSDEKGLYHWLHLLIGFILILVIFISGWSFKMLLFMDKELADWW